MPSVSKRAHQIANELSDAEAATLFYDWPFWARPEQLPPEGDWTYWVVLAGRGFGKTRTGAEWVRQQVQRLDLVNLIGATADDARDIMIEGESGILAVCPPDERPTYVASKRRLEWPNGAKSLIFTADEPDRLRGKQHMALWADELASWRYEEAWDQAMFGLRLGPRPQAVVTTTPKPREILRDLLTREDARITRGSTYDNRANLAPAFYEQIISRYEGTRLGRQELMAEMLDDLEGALWKASWFDDLRVQHVPEELGRVVVAIDPAVSTGENSDETGIVAAGKGADGHFYVLHDATGRYSPQEWAQAAVGLYHKLQGDVIVAEVNNGGDMVGATIRHAAPRVPYTSVRATRGKHVRAEPVSALYEQGRVHHVGNFDKLEDQLCRFTAEGYLGKGSPDRADALIWALTHLSRGHVTTGARYLR